MNCRLHILRSFILLISVVVCAISVTAAVLSMSLHFRKVQYNLNEFGNFIPKHFLVDSDYDTVIQSQGTRKMSAVFSFVSHIQGLYHKFLLQNNEITKDQIIEFSEQAFVSYLFKLCSSAEYKDKQFCTNMKTDEQLDFEDISLAFLFEAIQNIPEMSHSMFPKEVCKYSNVYGDYNCDNDLDSSQNPISFKINKIEWVNGVNSIKELLYDLDKPLLFTMPELMGDYYIRCSDPRVKNNDECSSNTTQTFECPYDKNENCGKLSFPARTYSGEFYLPQNPVRASPGYPLNFEIVGYSDSFIASRGQAKLDSVKLSKGGFIIKGFNKDEGFPISYFTGDITQSKAFNFCPNLNAPQHWTGPLLSCMKEKNDLTRCSAYSTDVIDDDSETKYAVPDQLICINSEFCNLGEEYIITHQPVRTYETVVYEEESGMTITKMMKLNDNESLEIDFNKVPFYQLGYVFKNNLNYDSRSLCGYWFLPYDVVDKAMEISKDLGTHVNAYTLDIEFSESSLPSKMEEGYYSHLLKQYTKLPLRPVTSYDL